MWWYLESKYLFTSYFCCLKFKNLLTNILVSSFFFVFFYSDRVGRNVAAGMTGGLAYILDEDDTLIPKVFV